MNLKIISFFPKIPDFTSGDVVRFTGKFPLNEEPPHDDILEVIFNLLFIQVQDDDDLFKSIKLNVNEFVGKGNVADKFNIKCKILKSE
ncbi:hypothetical protein GLOIN_2v1768708 [Rhizophagus irregularis DAOM 181602=DAOM 197198]|uniref:Uncharacterized protein n=1 Tax=Rhizophagus irregularis (strain DAOM 181602 / DAOM 197198 / MUCL 43194) TaxID=747089 RepID=A0A2P4QG39_RHIID|nr:hypothetical protein GLOIN_2v1768708 [Rhizophagus irregularis DAOM 181602=DAOM 197198]POG76586.1 hypothetical protein GLOIN_2v1768708 [Rhizophagus irregularis DAOM 181602=DAOM 197198]GET53009.1 hypothetical protein GLOIN_2v1768708 [Rhizophagus irregularis DAOM 181602=DAOM 197198]|eukprot:XP_025183452.1 hypothetical protein GLOIN_2v1768708 [Rhizophagus irregularis DAOM 181602=DAOM 197198]